jgi:CHASE2 domain-containing sensor protein
VAASLGKLQWPRLTVSRVPAATLRFGLAVAAVAFLCALAAPHVGLFRRLELTTWDIRLRLRGERPIHPALATVEIDDPTVFTNHNQWPFARDQYAVLVNGLQRDRVRAIGFDLLFAGPDVNEPPLGTPITNDQLLAAVLARDPRVVNGFYMTLQEPDHGAPAESLAYDPHQPAWKRFTMPLPEGVHLLSTTEEAQFDIDREIADSTFAFGHVALSQDDDGTTRALPLLIEHQGRAFPSLSLLLVARALGADWRAIRFANGHAELPYPDGLVRIPVDRNAQVLINYPGPDKVFKNGPSFHRFADVMDDFRKRDALEAAGRPVPALPSDALRDKVVLVCNTAIKTATADFGQTPFGQNFPLAYAHASVVNSILRGDYLTRAPRGGEAIVWAVLAIALALGLGALAPVGLALTTLGVMLLWLAAAQTFTTFGGMMIDVVPPVLMIGAISIGHLLRGYVERDRQRRASEQELAVARRIQQDLLPHGLLAAGAIEVSGINRPCFAVGGDYFDYFKLEDGRLALAIADVAGKGVPAAILMSNLQAILRAECARGGSVPHVPAQANRQLMDSMGGNSKFVTFFYGALDPVARRLSYSNAGHNPPLVVRKNGGIEELSAGGLILGVFPLAEYEEASVDLNPGDVVVLFTDGVTEAESRSGLYGDERLHELLRREHGGSAAAIAEAICRDVDRFSHGLHQTDDVTVVVVKVADDAAPRAVA